LPEPLSRPQSVGWTKFLARRQANVDLPRRHDSRLRSIFRKHARESALTSLGALLFHLVFGDRPRSRRTQSVERGSRFAIVIRLVVQQNGDAGCAKVCPTPPTNRLTSNTHRMMGSNASKAHPARDAPRCGQLPIAPRLYGGREWGSMRFHRKLDDTRSFVRRSPTQVGRHRATKGARDRAARNGV
jgi:hypothetical protein